MFLTENQRKWVALLREAVKMKPKVTFKKGRPKVSFFVFVMRPDS